LGKDSVRPYEGRCKKRRKSKAVFGKDSQAIEKLKGKRCEAQGEKWRGEGREEIPEV